MRAVTATIVSASFVLGLGVGVAFAQAPRDAVSAAHRSITEAMMHLRDLGQRDDPDTELRRGRAMAYLSLAQSELQEIPGLRSLLIR